MKDFKSELKNELNQKNSKTDGPGSVLRAKNAGKFTILILILFLIAFSGICVLRSFSYKKLTEAQPLSHLQQVRLNSKLQQNYSSEYKNLKKLPYEISDPKLNVLSESAILIDVKSGNILYEKNADQVIPPASMTKLFAMNVVLDEIKNGNLTYEEEIPLPSQTWASNMPPHSSLMFLGKGQHVTTEEILLGMAVSSGNDAAYAAAYKICGNMDDFVARMNQTALSYGLKNTKFVESSGYSEQNTTTAREMADFARIYLIRHPETIQKFHSVQSFTYPKEKNMADKDVYGPQDFSNGIPDSITMGITQKNTNPLLGKLDGVDGLKTGYIEESGYNLSLTAERNGTRFLSVTMKGPGNNTQEGNETRIHDGTELLEWAFNSFCTYENPKLNESHAVLAYATNEKIINLVPAFKTEALTIPFIAGKTSEENISKIKIETEIPSSVCGEISEGQQFGKIKIMLLDYVLKEIPLVADRSTTKPNIIFQAADKLLYGLEN